MRRIIPAVILGLALLACSLVPAGPILQEAASPSPAPSMPSPVPTVPPLTLDLLKNGIYQLVFQDSHPTVQLKDGLFQSPGDPTSVDYKRVNLIEPVAFGDLNGDGSVDAAVLLAENYGGSGVFVSVLAILDQGGKPVQAASEIIDDRPKINSLSIQGGQMNVDAIIHGPNDPGCCAAWPTKRSFRYQAGKLVMLSFSSGTPDGGERVISVDAPPGGGQVSWPVTVTGHVTIAPFENTLLYSVFNMNNDQLATGTLLVQANGLGGPGTFSVPIDLSKAGVTGPVRIQFEDSSPADASILALDSVDLTIK